MINGVAETWLVQPMLVGERCKAPVDILLHRRMSLL